MSRIVLLVGFVLGTVLTGCADSAPRPVRDEPVLVVVANVSEADAGPGTTFSVSTPDVTGLYPGTTKQLTLTVSNPYDFAITVTDLWGHLDRTSKGGCAPSASNLSVRAHEGVLPTVPRRTDRAAGTIPLYMPNTVAEACQRAQFTISLRGTAKKAGGS